MKTLKFSLVIYMKYTLIKSFLYFFSIIVSGVICLNAFILINTERGKLWKVAEEALKIEGVKIAHAVTGQYDVIVYAEFIKINDLSEIIDKVQSIDGVLRTTTAIAMAPRLS